MPTNPTNVVINNMVGGEVSPRMYARIDLPLFKKSMAKINNFIPMPQGGGAFRCGSAYVKNTRLNKKGWFIPFSFNEAQSFEIEVTDSFMRFYTQNSVVTETPKNISGVTNANPAVITSAAHGFSDGDEVFVSGVLGTNQINGQFYIVAGSTTDTFNLEQVPADAVDSGAVLDTTNYGVYAGGGTAARVYKIASPYLEADIPFLQYAQSANTVYLTCVNYATATDYAPRKLVRVSSANWTIGTYARTNDPFGAGAG